MIEERPWDEGTSRLLQLQDKIKYYLAFILDGHMGRMYPASRGKLVTIQLDCSHEPNTMALDYLEAARSMLNELGVSLKIVVR